MGGETGGLTTTRTKLNSAAKLSNQTGPPHFRVVRHLRPKFSCRQCETITQAPAPSLPIRRGRAGPGLLAHVLVAKFCDHLPLYRQSEIYAREGVDVERSTLADWVGQSAALLRPLVDALERHVMAGDRLHADDTPVPVLAPGTGKTSTGRLWAELPKVPRAKHVERQRRATCATSGPMLGRPRLPCATATPPTAGASTPGRT